MLCKIVPFALLAMAAPAQAADFSCNLTPETVQCRLDGCSETGHYLSISLQKGNLSFCEGEGCAEGPVLMRRERGPVTFVYATVTSNGTSPASYPLSLMLDRAHRIVHVSSGDDNRLIKCAADQG